MSLALQKCETCSPESPQVSGDELTLLMKETPEWQLKTRDNIQMLERVFKFKTYKRSVAFTNEIAGLAAQERHHPEILLEWGKVTVTWWTHDVNGLHKNDFICAAKTDTFYEE